MDGKADFVIVGGGTAGLLLANRLAHTDSKPTVLVLEAGADRSDLSYRTPSKRFSLWFTNPELDHGFSTTPQGALLGRTLPYARGKGLGGSSLSNFMIYLSGSKEDYNYWAELVGDDTWSWVNSHRRLKEVLENFHGSVPAEFKHLANPSMEGHGHSGPVDVSLQTSWEKGMKELLEGAANNGVPTNLDVNSGNPIGVGIIPTAVANGFRTTSASANLKDIPDNLHIWTEATVNRVILEGTHAVAVEMVDGRKAFARHEVILSAGAFNTPKILMLSGIGPQDHLAQHGIPVVKHLPGIGQGLKDHPAVFLTARMKSQFFFRAGFEASPSTVAAAQGQWDKDGTGEMAKQFSTLLVMFNKLPDIYNTPEFHALPEQEKEYLKRDTVPHYEAISMGPKFPLFLEVPEGKEYLNLTVFGMNPQSSGTVTLASANPEDAAIIDPKALTHPFDKKVLVDGLIDAITIFKETEIYQKGFEGWLNGPASLEREVIEKLVDEQGLLVWHANGTVKMGKNEEEGQGACVDSVGRVFGVKGLRVADMSVSPLTINGHTAAAAYLIGATAAEKMIEEYKL